MWCASGKRGDIPSSVPEITIDLSRLKKWQDFRVQILDFLRHFPLGKMPLKNIYEIFRSGKWSEKTFAPFSAGKTTQKNF
jgi:hypothetical protein